MSVVTEMTTDFKSRHGCGSEIKATLYNAVGHRYFKYRRVKSVYKLPCMMRVGVAKGQRVGQPHVMTVGQYLPGQR